MEPIFYVIAMFGCADTESACREVRVNDARYATPDLCRAATPAALSTASDLDFPVVTAICRPGEARLAAAIARPRG